MNILILTLLLIIQGTELIQNPDIESFKWLIGTWKNAKYGSFESWQLSDQQNSLIGKAYRITAASDTVITEEMKIACEEEACYFIADISENPRPTRFKIVSWDANSFRSENPDHDFPKFVAYRILNNKSLEAKIGDDVRTVKFKFERTD